MSRWTQEDEATLQEMLSRKQQDFDGKRDCVVRLVARVGLDDSYKTPDEVVDLLIEHASSLRVVLEPFDDGEVK